MGSRSAAAQATTRVAAAAKVDPNFMMSRCGGGEDGLSVDVDVDVYVWWSKEDSSERLEKEIAMQRAVTPP